MEKAGWQITTGALAITCIGLTLGVIANKNALAETQRHLAEIKESKKPETETLTIVQREPCPYSTLPMTDDKTECRGGVLLTRTENGWVSVTNKGKAVGCNGG